jgi:hypothetical protein
MSDVERLQGRVVELRDQRAEVEATRTKEDVRELAESWLAAACRRVNGTAGLVLNGHANPPEIQSVIAEFIFDSPALLEFIVRRVEATAQLTNRDRSAKLKRLDAAIAKAEQEAREQAKAAALAEVEERFGGVAA